MSQEQRVVAYSVTEKSKSKKGKKSTKEVSKIGLFHVWSATGKGNKKFTGLVEDAQTGVLTEVNYKNIRFLSDLEVEALTSAAITEAENLLEEIEAATEPETAAVTETPQPEETTATSTEETVAEAKPKRGRKA
ncbi:MAG: hypothetical protein ACLGH8_15990 [Bacteroidia bacterium]